MSTPSTPATRWFINEDGDTYQYDPALQRQDFPGDWHEAFPTQGDARNVASVLLPWHQPTERNQPMSNSLMDRVYEAIVDLEPKQPAYLKGSGLSGDALAHYLNVPAGPKQDSIARTMSALNRLVTAGHVKRVGHSSYSVVGCEPRPQGRLQNGRVRVSMMELTQHFDLLCAALEEVLIELGEPLAATQVRAQMFLLKDPTQDAEPESEENGE